MAAVEEQLVFYEEGKHETTQKMKLSIIAGMLLTIIIIIKD